MTETNFDKAVHVCMSLDMDDGDVPSPLDYVRALRDAGLLAPDLPEPTVTSANNNPVWRRVPLWTWANSGKIGLVIDLEHHAAFTPDTARQQACVLLAAANYAEKERPCSTS